MRASLAATVVIAVFAAGLGWHNSRRIADIEGTRRALAQEAAELGISTKTNSGPVRPTKRKRPARAVAPKLSTSALIALVKATRDAPSVENQLRLIDSLSVLGPEEMEAFLAEIGGDPELDVGMRRMIVNDCIGILARNHPQAALELSIRNPNLIGDGWARLSLVRTALVSLVASDPQAAIDWVGKHPKQISDEDKREMISAVAPGDVTLAFRLVGDLKFQRTVLGVQEIVGSAGTLDEKSAVLAGLREYLAGIAEESVRNDELRSCFTMLSRHLEREDFEIVTRWIADENLNARELDPILDHFTTGYDAETGPWIDWMREALPAGPADARISDLIHQWVQIDYRAAARWAATQAPGMDRDSIWKIINDQWPTHDAAGKAAFGKEYGME